MDLGLDAPMSYIGNLYLHLDPVAWVWTLYNTLEVFNYKYGKLWFTYTPGSGRPYIIHWKSLFTYAGNYYLHIDLVAGLCLDALHDRAAQALVQGPGRKRKCSKSVASCIYVNAYTGSLWTLYQITFDYMWSLFVHVCGSLFDSLIYLHWASFVVGLFGLSIKSRLTRCVKSHTCSQVSGLAYLL